MTVINAIKNDASNSNGQSAAVAPGNLDHHAVPDSELLQYP
jgi:hypothetical protein